MRLLAALRRLPRAPLELFVGTRLLIWAGTALAYLVLEAQYAQPLDTQGAEDVVQHDVGWAIDMWARADSGWYTQIAQHGYVNVAHSAAFFPLYPLAMNVVGYLVGGHYVLAGFLISMVASAGAFVLLWELGLAAIGETATRRALLYLAVFPTTLFLMAVYSESLYLLLSAAAFVCARRGRWAYAGIAVGLAALTRSSGVMLLPALALLAWQVPQRKRAFAGLALAVPIGAAWPLFLWAKYDRPFVFLSAQRAGWDRQLSHAGPFGGFWDGLVSGWHGMEQLFAGGNHFPDADHGEMYGAGINLEQLGYTLFLVVLAVVVWRRLGAAYGLFVALSLVLPLSDPVPSSPLFSMPRFVLGVFPVFFALGTLGARRRVDLALTAGFTLLLGLNVARWVLWRWIA